jgi:Fe-S cluster assembly ATP-binding protein
MGPNGTGKSTLAYAVMGHPKYEITDGDVCSTGRVCLTLAPDERSRAGFSWHSSTRFPFLVLPWRISCAQQLMLGAEMQKPPQEEISILEFRKLLKSKMDLIELEYSFGGRYLNEGFSGGEKKRTEVLQLAVLEPAFAILDETDSGLDIDAIRIVSEGVNALKGSKMGVVVITHYQRI